MANKKISYLARDFESVRSELIKFSNQYYPEVADDFNDSSVGAWFIDLLAAVGDDLSYYVDRAYQETTLDSANSRSSILNMAKSYGLKIPGKKASICEISLSCVLPPSSGGDISKPDWDLAPIVQMGSIFSAGNINFELAENINFKEQFNDDGYPNRTIVPARNNNGLVTGYTVTKTALATNGTTKVYKKVISASDARPFMEVVLPEADVMSVESVIFKEGADPNSTPKVYEYYIDSEEYRFNGQSVMTYRFFECDSLADQWRFGTSINLNDVFSGSGYSGVYDDYTEGDDEVSASTRTTRVYRGEWKPLKQKFITEYTNNGYLKLIFGAGNEYTPIPDENTPYFKYAASRMVNNDMLGVIPREGWTMYVLYRTGGGISTNLGPNAVNKITQANVEWQGGDSTTRGQVLTSFTVTNVSTAVAGKDAPSLSEIKNLVKYNTSAQNRAVVVNDYKLKLMQMPPKYGAPFRASVIEENNKIKMSLLGLDSNGKLDPSLPQTLVENIVEYMKGYRQINDYIEIRSGKIYNIGVGVDLFIDKNYNKANVIENVITKIAEYFDVNKHDMGEDIFVGDLEKEITLVDGVISLIALRIYKIWNSGYSPDKCPLPTKNENGCLCETTPSPVFTTSNGASSEEIDLDEVDKVLISDYDAMYEIRYKTDIQIRCKTR